MSITLSPVRITTRSHTITPRVARNDGSRSAIKTGAQYFTFPAAWKGSVAQMAALEAHLIGLRGGHVSFLYVPPHLATPRGVATGSPVVASNTAAGVSAVPISGLTVSTTGILLKGDALTFAGHNKYYRLVSDANSDGAGEAMFEIRPALVESVTAAEVLTLTGAAVTCKIEGAVMNFKTDNPEIRAISATLSEFIS